MLSVKQDKRSILFIINTVSGTKNKDKLPGIIKSYTGHAFIDAEIAFTKYKGHGKDLALKAINENKDTIVVAGGDGSINEVADVLVNSNVALGIIPTGSGNGFARHLKIPRNYKKAVKIINENNTISIDTLTVNDKLCCNLAGLGFDAKIAYEFALSSKRGFFSYLKCILKVFPNYKNALYQIIYDDKELKTNAFLITVANSSQYGNGAVIAPNAKIDDSLADICVMKKVTWLNALYIGFMLMTGLLHKTSAVKYIKAKSIEIKQSDDFPGHIDGDYFFPGKEMNIKVNPLSLKVIVPGK